MIKNSSLIKALVIDTEMSTSILRADKENWARKRTRVGLDNPDNKHF